MSSEKVPLQNRYCLTLEEAAEYFGIGVKRMRALAKSQAGCQNFVLLVGTKYLIKRKQFEAFLNRVTAV